jgi:ssDNA thymidine ADP-ribosyltransferase, DarT
VCKYQIKRRKEAEFLIAEDVPSEALVGYVVYNEAVQKQLTTFDISIEKIVVRPNFYF